MTAVRARDKQSPPSHLESNANFEVINLITHATFKNSQGEDSDPTRLQLIMPKATLKRLERLKVATGASSLAEVCRRAIQLYDGVVQEAGVGGEVVFRRPNRDELAVPTHLLVR